jgi:hypothetical protein
LGVGGRGLPPYSDFAHGQRWVSAAEAGRPTVLYDWRPGFGEPFEAGSEYADVADRREGHVIAENPRPFLCNLGEDFFARLTRDHRVGVGSRSPEWSLKWNNMMVSEIHHVQQAVRTGPDIDDTMPRCMTWRRDRFEAGRELCAIVDQREPIFQNRESLLCEGNQEDFLPVWNELG